MLRDVGEELGASLGMAVRFCELHHRAVRFAWHEKRFFPLRIPEIDLHGMKPGAAHALDCGEQVGDLARHVMGTGAVALEEASEEVVAFDLPRFEQLDGHAVAVVASEPDLHRTEPDRLPAEDDPPAHAPGQRAQRFRCVGCRERDVIEVVVIGHGGGD